MKLSLPLIFALLRWPLSTHAQQFVGARQSYNVMGLSDKCTQVLDTELKECHSQLFHHTDRTTDNIVNVLPRKELDLICKPKCREELSGLRDKIIQTCTSPKDLMRHSGLELPAVYFADKFAYTYDLNCYKHKSSGRFCDEVYAEWRAGKVDYDECDDCYLGQLALQLSSPIGVSAELATLFSSTRERCNDSSYNNFKFAQTYVKRIGQTSMSAAAASRGPAVCERSYTVKQGDTCHSVAVAQNSSTLSLVQINALNINCHVMPDEGTELCLDRPCETHTIQAGEDCRGISKKFGILQSDLRALNPMLDSTCSNIKRWEGYVVCVGPQSLINRQKRSSRTKEYEPLPITPLKPLAPGSSDKCTLFVNGRAPTDPDLLALQKRIPSIDPVESTTRSNKCGVVTDANGVSAQAFRELNPSLMKNKLPSDKCVLEEQYSYCLAEEGGPKPHFPDGWSQKMALRWG